MCLGVSVHRVYLQALASSCSWSTWLAQWAPLNRAVRGSPPIRSPAQSPHKPFSCWLYSAFWVLYYFPLFWPHPHSPPFLEHLLTTYYEQESLLRSFTYKDGYDIVSALKEPMSRPNSLNLAFCLINLKFLSLVPHLIPLWSLVRSYEGPSSDRFLIVGKRPCLCLSLLAPRR